MLLLSVVVVLQNVEPMEELYWMKPVRRSDIYATQF